MLKAILRNSTAGEDKQKEEIKSLPLTLTLDLATPSYHINNVFFLFSIHLLSI